MLSYQLIRECGGGVKTKESTVLEAKAEAKKEKRVVGRGLGAGWERRRFFSLCPHPSPAWGCSSGVGNLIGTNEGGSDKTRKQMNK